MKIKKGDTIKTKDGEATVLYTENFRNCDRAVIKLKVVPLKFEGFKTGVAYFYSEILEVNGTPTKLKVDPWNSMSGDYINEHK